MRPLPSPSLELEKRGGGLGMDIDLGNETSVWEEDDDDEGMGGLVGSLRSRLHIRSSSAQEEVGGELGVKVRQGKRMKRSLSEVVKGVFRVRRKGGTL
jgi:predicted acetyltransferase